ncbi:hypothetical protein F5B19DRAFT_239031 [Rostrohypoxylon terebratum]|nr:hypothetical protein F5B19DRAFT_239031 [Rostrohypoxylon terebratum]
MFFFGFFFFTGVAAMRYFNVICLLHRDHISTAGKEKLLGRIRPKHAMPSAVLRSIRVRGAIRNQSDRKRLSSHACTALVSVASSKYNEERSQ